MDDKKYFWLKLKRDFFKRHDIRIIESMPNGKDYILFYLKLLCESVDHDGNLRFSDSIPYSEDMLSTITNTNIDIVRSAIKVFTELNMMEILDDGTYFMNEVNKMIGCETEWAIRKRKQRLLPKLTNGSVRLNGEMLKLPNGETRYVDEKRYGGNGMLALDRARGKCELCGSEENVVIHHNNGYSNEINDLLCLCSKCHSMVHSKYGGNCPPSVHPLSDKSKSIDKDINIDIYKESIINNNTKENSLQKIFDYWNSKGIIKHKLNDDIKKAIDKVLKEYSVEDIKKSIDHYKEVLDSNYFFNYKWSIVDFLNRKGGFKTFLDDGSNWVNYCEFKSKPKTVMQVNGLPAEELPEGYMYNNNNF